MLALKVRLREPHPVGCQVRSVVGLWLIGAAWAWFGACPLSVAEAQVHADVATDAPVLLRLAERGDAKAAWLLGTRYASGRGGVRDDSEALRWFRTAAELGLPEAQYNIGIMYATGRAVPPDLVESARWFMLAAQQGLPVAQYNVGAMFSDGRGLPRDDAQAAQWFRRAAEAGVPQAQYNLAVLYEYGRGVALNPDLAVRWYQAAARSDYGAAKERLAALGAQAGAAARSAWQGGPADAAASPAVALEGPGGARPRASTPGSGTSAAVRSAVDSEHPLVSLERLDPSFFTLQLVSHADPERAQAYIDQFSIGAHARYFAVRKGRQIFFSVVHGVYPNRDQATRAWKSLPRELRRGKPWVRSIAGLRKALAPTSAVQATSGG